jgi:hypothetical protein
MLGRDLPLRASEWMDSEWPHAEQLDYGPCLDTGGGLWLERSRGNTARKTGLSAAYHLVCGLLAGFSADLRKEKC